MEKPVENNREPIDFPRGASPLLAAFAEWHKWKTIEEIIAELGIPNFASLMTRDNFACAYVRQIMEARQCLTNPVDSPCSTEQ